ncbi:glycerophosphodiester phosphodiesterase family protein [Pedobacter cryotolerans]|uniref:Glycerophosphodiester phosphodiesterase n=1 Tax=Pedobacter cryotolerans TaxID=2571270 RepID=A0A4U1C7M2_9SPHI|nr:glycerophosphodiester phosphodiesterase family protein [Pedobacter cryotolerans]TKC01454.1 glycerophosphodiester phosphodiesterase [Pedobacter cryotolerans]
MKANLILIGLLLSSSAFSQQKLDVQAHRGGMALLPENTIPAMLNAVKLGAKTLELDVVISADGKVVVSHDNYMSATFMSKPNGTEIDKADEKNHNIYQIGYDSVRKYSLGVKNHPMFPEQQKLKSHKPLLTDLIDSVEAYVKKNNLRPVYYNIETKCSPLGDDKFHPKPAVFVKNLMDVINQKNIKPRLIIQSFDVRTLQVLHQTEPTVKLALLVQGKMNISEDQLKKYGLSAQEVEAYLKQMNAKKGGLDEELANLGFTPAIYSPYYSGVDAEMVKKVHEKKMLILPWTVDKKEDMIALAKMGVDGIITNKPDVLIELVGNYQNK